MGHESDHIIDELRDAVNKALQDLNIKDSPKELYDPIRYMFEPGGKRIRPVMVLLACNMFRDSYQEAIPAALAVEVFHNFTLVHDDIMDKAPIRRGKETVYKKWNSDIAILVGDTMLSLAYDLLISIEKDKPLAEILRLFNQTSIEVCEGQQFDMNFEGDMTVTIPQYLEMIRLKTAVLLGASLCIGSMIGGAYGNDQKLIYNIGINMGIAFQLRDDLLDLYGEEEKFGKKTGGDIATNKKTFLYLKALEKASPKQRSELHTLFGSVVEENANKINTVKEIFDNLEIQEETVRLIDSYYQKVVRDIDSLSVNEDSKEPIRALTSRLVSRSY